MPRASCQKRVCCLKFRVESSEQPTRVRSFSVHVLSNACTSLLSPSIFTKKCSPFLVQLQLLPQPDQLHLLTQSFPHTRSTHRQKSSIPPMAASSASLTFAVVSPRSMTLLERLMRPPSSILEILASLVCLQPSWTRSRA